MAHLHLLVGSTLGAAEYVADHLAERLQAAGHRTSLHNPADLATLSCAADEVLLVVTATHGAGDIPDNLKPFADSLARQQPDLSACYLAVVALGDSNYDTFCAAGQKMEALLLACGARPLGQRLEIDVTRHDIPEDAADLWLDAWLPQLAAIA